jgi:hypothetical protein
MASRTHWGAGARYPLGTTGVAATAAVVGALVGLALPMGWIEEAAFQLYVDRLIPTAVPPLGLTARLAAMAALALGLGVLGWLLATWLRVRPSATSLADWVARLRGARPDDEDDAPTLRAADRHPDAPARRPFSAARDVVVDEDGDFADAAPVSHWDELADEELLLDAQFDENVAPEPVDEAAREARWEELERVDDVDQVPVIEPVVEVLPEVEAAAEVVAAPEVEADPAAAAPTPLDLSVARLDELIARLEAGLTRKQEAAMAAPSAPVADAADVPAPNAGAGDAGAGDAAAVVQNDGEFPHDPALAAALATLRRMNRNS